MGAIVVTASTLPVTERDGEKKYFDEANVDIKSIISQGQALVLKLINGPPGKVSTCINFRISRIPRRIYSKNEGL